MFSEKLCQKTGHQTHRVLPSRRWGFSFIFEDIDSGFCKRYRALEQSFCWTWKYPLGNPRCNALQVWNNATVEISFAILAILIMHNNINLLCIDLFFVCLFFVLFLFVCLFVCLFVFVLFCFVLFCFCFCSFFLIKTCRFLNRRIKPT